MIPWETDAGQELLALVASRRKERLKERLQKAENERRESMFRLSLVGMTEGAKKRAVRRDAKPHWPQDDTTTVAAERLRYRVGQRLRPCPGCAQCVQADVAALGSLRRRAARIVSAICGAEACDGSGTLPARGSR